jgi:hypothetical protein
VLDRRHNGIVAHHFFLHGRPARQQRPGGSGGWLLVVLLTLLAGSGLAAALPEARLALAQVELPETLPDVLALPLASVMPLRAAGLEGIDHRSLMEGLAVADAAWTPRVESLPDGRIRYHYRRRSGDPPLSLTEVRALMANPPRFSRERRAIVALLTVLGRAGVRIQLEQPRRAGAAGEWDPRMRALRIKPAAIESGSAEFAKVLNHEAFHVAQSCSGGHLRAMPRPLGLPAQVAPQLAAVFNEPVYRSAGPLELQLEREAYANQHRLELGAALVGRHCRLADPT